jgi:hypothetical protein
MKNRILKTVNCLILGVAILIPCNSQGFLYHGPLTKEDLAIQVTDRENGPVLSSSIEDPNRWESFNQWICFPSKDLKVLKVEIEYDGRTKSIPQIDGEKSGHLFQISLDGDMDGNFEHMFEKWRQIVRASREVCVYAAFLQEGPMIGQLTSSLWIIDRIKGDGGQWTLDEEQSSSWVQSNTPRQFGEYTVAISSSEDRMEETVRITKSDRVVFEESESGSHYYFGNFTDGTDSDSYSGTDLNGNSIPDLMISKWTGGAHCCNFLYIFELGETFRHITTVEGGSYGFQLASLDGDNIPEIELSDGAIDYQFASFAFSPPGRVVLKFIRDHYEVDSGIMKKPLPSSEVLSRVQSSIRLAFQQQDSPDLPYDLLKIMMDLSYSGHLNAAFMIADQTWPDQKSGLEKFKVDFKQALDESPYWPKLNR